MASTPVSVEENNGAGEDSGKGFIRVILADTQAIFRAGLRKIFALEDDIRVVGQAETLAQTLTAIKKFSADVVIFESALTANPVEAVADLLRQSSEIRLVVVIPASSEELTLDMLNLQSNASDMQVKWAVANHFDLPAHYLNDYVVVRNSQAIIVRPEAIYG